MHISESSKSGFSLLELSIVLVIIGLIAGGIVAGSSMIRAAELRAILTEKEGYTTALYTFRDKYLGLPGDLKNATAFWGEIDSDQVTCITTPSSTGTETCNGNGDGTIWGGADHIELYSFWKQLSNAGLAPGNFANAGITAPYDTELGVNIPESKVSGGGWMSYNSSGSFAEFGNTFLFGAPGVTYMDQPILTPEEAWGIDKKTDDGIALSGKLRADPAGSCHDSGASAPEPYDLTNKNIECILIFEYQF